MKSFVLLIVPLLTLALLKQAQAEDNVHFSGALIAISCTLPDSDKDININFGVIVEKYLYKYQRTKSQPFTLHLQNCNPKVAGTINVTFEGTADSELTNMLALDAGSTAKGIAIGLESVDGKLLPINKATSYMQLTEGDNPLTFNAFIQMAPSATSSNNLTAGEFSATSTFVLAYQ
ncbi:fimbrial protein [Cronobacter dublinensis]|uniref:fimbrial protein n=1 Tax=Cronobacter dublinensis TaxID=413497 RepID=UPI000CFAD2C6|nr:fimbrial protein [Cronobacter dublinensis]